MKKILQSNPMRKLVKAVSGLALVYVLVYLILSTFGCYRPDAWDLNGPMHYSWAPAGFYDAKHAWPGSVYAVRHPNEKTGGWSAFMSWAFLPLFYLDNQFIHKEPSNTTLPMPAQNSN
jgi:hypothetical protein